MAKESGRRSAGCACCGGESRRKKYIMLTKNQSQKADDQPAEQVTIRSSFRLAIRQAGHRSLLNRPGLIRALVTMPFVATFAGNKATEITHENMTHAVRQRFPILASIQVLGDCRKARNDSPKPAALSVTRSEQVMDTLGRRIRRSLNLDQ